MKVSILKLLSFCVPGRLGIYTTSFSNIHSQKGLAVVAYFTGKGSSFSMLHAHVLREHSHWSIFLLTDSFILPADWLLIFCSCHLATA